MVQGACNNRILYTLTKVDIGIECNIMVEKILVGQQDEICTEGQVISCLADSAGRADRRGIVVRPRLLNLPKHKQ